MERAADRPGSLFRNSGDGSFEDATVEAGLDVVQVAAFVAWEDYDGDELLDVFVGTHRGPSHLMRNIGGYFVDVSAEVGIVTSGADRSAHWMDVDGDGGLDLHLVSAEANTIYRALGNGSFEPMSLPTLATARGESSALPLAMAGSTEGREPSPASPESPIVRGPAGTRVAPPSGTAALGGGGSPGVTVTPTGSATGATPSAVSCVASLDDPFSGSCIEASATATLGMLYPLSDKFFIEEATGRVGIGTTTPNAELSIHNVGSVDGAKMLSFGEGNNSSFAFESGFSPTDGDNYMSVSTALTGSAMTWKSDGRVGIGTASPLSTLHVEPAGNAALFMRRGGQSVGHQFVSGSLGFRLAEWNDTTQTPLLDISYGGNVGIGTTSPSAKLDVAGDVKLDSSLVLDNSAQDDTWKVFVASSNRLGFRDEDAGTTHMILTGDGRLGIGTTSPNSSLDVVGEIRASTAMTINGATVHPGPHTIDTDTHGTDSWTDGAGVVTTSVDVVINNQSTLDVDNNTLFVDSPNNRVGILTYTPSAALDVNGTARVARLGVGTSTATEPLTIEVAGTGRGLSHKNTWGLEMGSYADSTNGWFGTFTNHGLKFFVNDSSGDMILTSAGDLGIGTLSPTAKLDVNGTAKVQVLTITGGADIVEGFDTSDDESLEPGTVVVIDPDAPGALMSSNEAYDRKVAGVVSGANGVHPGLHLGQESTMDGDTKVAMTGRVFVKCSTENGAIRPGDRLTTASLAGHAMKATDREHCDGAVLGKAMSSLDAETGLVLVLVNLQ